MRLNSDFFQENTKAERGLGLLGDAEETAANDVTISFSYAYHNRTYPTFSQRTLDVTMTSL